MYYNYLLTQIHSYVYIRELTLLFRGGILVFWYFLPNPDVSMVCTRHLSFPLHSS